MVFEIEANVANNVVAFSGWVVGGRPARCAHADTHARTNASPCFFELGAHKSSRRAFACVHVCTHAYIYAVRSNARMHNVHTHLHKFMYVFCQSLTSAAGDRPSCQIAMEFRDLAPQCLRRGQPPPPLLPSLRLRLQRTTAVCLRQAAAVQVHKQRRRASMPWITRLDAKLVRNLNEFRQRQRQAKGRQAQQKRMLSQ